MMAGLLKRYLDIVSGVPGSQIMESRMPDRGFQP
jgi:hypothetical protein